MISNWLLVKVSAFSGALLRAEHAWRNLPIGGVYDPCFPCWVRYIFEMVSARQRGGHQNDQNGGSYVLQRLDNSAKRAPCIYC